MLISKTNTEGWLKVDLPHEAGQFIQVVPMTAAVFEDALAAAESRTRRSINDFDKDVAVEVLRGAGDSDDEKREKVKAKRAEKRRAPDYDDLDRMTILRGCICGWSYDAPVDDATIGTLDNRTADYVAREIYRLSIFNEEEQGNS